MTRSFNSRTHHHTTMNMFSRYSRIAHPSNHIVNKQAINPCSIAVDQSLSIFFPYNVCTWTFFFFYPFFSLSRDIPFLPLWNDYTAICRSSSILSSLVTWNPRCVHFFFLPFLFRCIFDDNRRGLSDIWISIPMFHRRAAILNRDFLSTTGISLSPRCAIVTPLFKRSIDFSLVKISPPRGWLMMLICISRSSIDSVPLFAIRNFSFSSFLAGEKQEKNENTFAKRRTTHCENASFLRFEKENSILPGKKRTKIPTRILEFERFEIRNIFQTGFNYITRRSQYVRLGYLEVHGEVRSFLGERGADTWPPLVGLAIDGPPWCEWTKVGAC